MGIGDKDLPYIPGGDVCGIVEAVPPSFTGEFAVGDKVVATWDTFGTGGLAEYTKVNPKLAVKLPKSLSMQEGAALANSASHALKALGRAKIKKGDRVLVLGGGGGVGTILVQMLKLEKASYVAATSTDELLMKDLNVDKVVDYTKEDWSQVKEWKENKFDCIIDCAVGVEAWQKSSSVLKSCKKGGRFVAVVLNEWHLYAKNMLQIFGILGPPVKRQLFNMFRLTTPYYRMYMDTPNKDTMKTVIQMAENKSIKVVIDSESPHDLMNIEEIHKAWNKHIARKGRGKIVFSFDSSVET